jgi:hypothetical protein
MATPAIGLFVNEKDWLTGLRWVKGFIRRRFFGVS